MVEDMGGIIDASGAGIICSTPNLHGVIPFHIPLCGSSLFSTSADNIIKKEKALKKELLTIFERYFSSFAPRCDIYLRTERFSNTSLLCDLARLSKAKAVFCRS